MTNDETQLGPTATETIMGLVRNAFEYQPQWLDRYFPQAADRGSVEYSDVDNMDRNQADACRFLLVQKIEYATRKARNPPSFNVAEEQAPNGFAYQVARLEETLAELCNLYDLPMPLARPGAVG